MSFPFEIQHLCVKSRNGHVWYAADSASFYATEEAAFQAEARRLNGLYPELEFAVLLYDVKRVIAPAKYRPWISSGANVEPGDDGESYPVLRKLLRF